MVMYLLFDADQTFLDFKETERIALSILFSHFNLPSTEETKSAYMQGNLLCWDEFERNLITLEELEEKRMYLFFQNLGRSDLDYKEASIVYADALSENGVLLPGAKEMLESLANYHKSVITNGLARVQWGRLRSTDTEKYFEHFFISQEMGVQKPRKEFFDVVLSTIKKDKDECIVIGDSEKSDIQGAVNSGLRSIFYSPEGKISTKATWSVTSYRELIALINSL